jgi:hypothetical protein
LATTKERCTDSAVLFFVTIVLGVEFVNNGLLFDIVASVIIVIEVIFRPIEKTLKKYEVRIVGHGG